MNVTKDKLENQRELVDKLQKEYCKVQKIFQRENTIMALMQEAYNAHNKLKEYEAEYKREL